MTKWQLENEIFDSKFIDAASQAIADYCERHDYEFPEDISEVIHFGLNSEYVFKDMPYPEEDEDE